MVREAFAAFNRGDLASVLDVQDEEVDWYPAIGRASGVPVSLDAWSLTKVRDGKATEFHDFDTRGEALEAAGLSE